MSEVCKGNLDWLRHEVDRLKQENTKLREVTIDILNYPNVEKYIGKQLFNSAKIVIKGG